MKTRSQAGSITGLEHRKFLEPRRTRRTPAEITADNQRIADEKVEAEAEQHAHLEKVALFEEQLGKAEQAARVSTPATPPAPKGPGKGEYSSSNERV
jgi:hypothetical protein